MKKYNVYQSDMQPRIIECHYFTVEGTFLFFRDDFGIPVAIIADSACPFVEEQK